MTQVGIKKIYGRKAICPVKFSLKVKLVQTLICCRYYLFGFEEVERKREQSYIETLSLHEKDERMIFAK